jgi:hypothetical protein
MSSGKHQAHGHISKRIADEMPRKMHSNFKKQTISSHASLNNTKKMYGNNIGGKTQIKPNNKETLQTKLSRNKSNLGKSLQKSRNPSKNSVSKQNDSQIRTYTTVLQDRRVINSQSNKSSLGSPDEINEKFRSDKTNKSSLTSSTTTHTNNIKKKRNSDKSKKRKSSCLDNSYVKKQTNKFSTKNKAMKTTAVRYDMIKQNIEKMDKKSNVTIDQKRLERALDFHMNHDDMNQTIDCNLARQEGINTIHKSDIIFKNRHSLASIAVNKSLKLQRRKSGSKSKKKNPVSRIKKSTIHDISSTALNATMENPSAALKEGITVRSGDSKNSGNNYLKRNKSTRFLKNIKSKDRNIFDQRK